jgi:IS5 family transposase
MQQLSFAAAEYLAKKKTTRRERFLTEMDQVVPWQRLVALIEPHYPKASPQGGRPPMPLQTMLRIYCLQQWFTLSDPAVEEALYDMESMRRFAGLQLGDTPIPDETTILNFRRLLERHQLTERLFGEIVALLRERGLMLREGTLVDATLIDAPSSTKNRTGQRDPEMSQTKKGNQWYFGMKAHIGVDAVSGLVHTVIGTTAKVADVTQAEALRHGEETLLCGDRGYDSAPLRARLKAAGCTAAIAQRRPPGGRLRRDDKALNRQIAQLRAAVEHPFHTVKRVFGYTKVRYRGLAKNTAQLYSLFALANLYRARHWLRLPRGQCA